MSAVPNRFAAKAEDLLRVSSATFSASDRGPFRGQRAALLFDPALSSTPLQDLYRPAAGHRRSEDEAAALIQTAFRRHRTSLQLRRRSFTKFGQEALELVQRYVETAGRQIEEEQFAIDARLILHFDINKTILISDRAQGSSVDHMVNVLLSECAWGRLEPGPQWVPVGRLATDRPASDPQLMTYRAYLDSFYLPTETEAGPAAVQRNAELKDMRKLLKRQFTETGQPGNMFRGVYDRLIEALTLPESCRNKSSSPLFASGLRHILPSFFNLLIHLQNQKRQAAIVFRSFGTDIPEVAEEINLFATGQHPCYPGVRMDGSDGGMDMRMQLPESAGAFHRHSSKPDGSCLYLGIPAAVLRSKDLHKDQLKAALPPGQQPLRSFKQMRDALLDFAQGSRSALALRDYYEHWKLRNERSRAGKLLLLDPSDDETLQIFFDDNISYTNAHIVDVRNVHTGESIPFLDVIGRQIHKVEALNAILDPQYYVRAVHECVHASLRASPAYARTRTVAFTTPERERPKSAGSNHTSPLPRSRSANMSKVVPIANASRRGRDLWELVNNRLVAMIRVRRAMQAD